ncbi:hypothetical protein NVV95_04045 [Herbiconiux sp. CPCC 205716]|uniref:Uncharacterized protein n=1 Tax=Herbiconiux gentiana TaxID=2970912 RepID=A0ABT2GC76_9MICO|nr:hypothetical protein [Herbiconiux gentiana]
MRIALRLIFALAILLLPAQLLFQRQFDQPYPGVFQPSFAGTPLTGDILKAQIPVVHVEFDDGASEEIPFEDVLPDSKLLDKSVFKSAFFLEDRATAPDTVKWLRGDLARMFPGREPVGMTVDWTDRRIDITGATETTDEITKTVVIDLTEGAR